MRIARVLHGGSPRPVIALERDGAVYDVGALDVRFAAKHASDERLGATDFFSRVIALGGAGLGELDDHLCKGERPTEARLLPDDVVWLPPCDPDRAVYVHVTFATDDTPAYRIGNVRGIVGHDAPVFFPASETSPTADPAIAAILGEDMRYAAAEAADRAILGYAILNAWTARDSETADGRPSPARDFATQLGPTLVTRDEIAESSCLRVQLRVDGAVVLDASTHPLSKLAEAVAFVSHHVSLRAGDVVGMSAVPVDRLPTQAAAAVPYGAHLELLIERLGKLGGRPMRGPATSGWRRS